MIRPTTSAIAALLLLSACKTVELSPLSAAQRTQKGYAYADAITAAAIRPHVYTLADDSMGGRDTGSDGEVKAALYLARHHARLGLTPVGDDSTFFQGFDLSATRTEGYEFTFTGPQSAFTMRVDNENADPVLVSSGAPGHHEGDIVFAGLGISDPGLGIDHLAGIDVRGKYLLIYGDIPASVTGWNTQRRFRDLVLTRGAKGIIAISLTDAGEFLAALDRMRGGLRQPEGLRLAYMPQSGRLFFQYYNITPHTASRLIGAANELEVRRQYADLSVNPTVFAPRMLDTRLQVHAQTGEATVKSRNVAALLPGSDPDVAHEVVVLVAHYDHVGIGPADETGDRLHNGADDNASGTTALLAIADALAEAKRNGVGPRRSVLFLHVSAEEKGLLGSRYYSDHPILPIENTVASINLDMVGRIEDARYATGDTNYVYLIGASLISSRLDSLTNAANAKTANLFLDPKLNDLNDPQQIYRRSDHWNFGRLGVPFVFLFSGLHDDYHRPSDSPDKIAYEVMAKRVRLAYGLTLEIANDTQRPVVDNQAFIERTRANPR
jgi:hypothetical protein